MNDEKWEIPGAKAAVLCIHGFSGSTHDMRPLGQALAARDIAAYVPLLPGHGGLPSALKGTTWRMWVDAACEHLRRVRESHEQVFLAGLSMGGLIALHLAATENHPPLRGVIALAAPSAINDPRTKLVRYARHVVPWFYPFKRSDLSKPGVRAEVLKRVDGQAINLDDPNVQREMVRNARIPLDAIHQLIELNNRVMRELPQVSLPTLFVQGRRDRTVAANSADVLAAGVGSRDKQVVWLPNSGHVLPHEPDAPEMFATIAGWMGERINGDKRLTTND